MRATAVTKFIHAAKRLKPDAFAEWINDNAAYLLQTEKQQIVDAWIEGNREGWEMNTDWPEHGERYYNKIYKPA